MMSLESVITSLLIDKNTILTILTQSWIPVKSVWWAKENNAITVIEILAEFANDHRMLQVGE